MENDRKNQSKIINPTAIYIAGFGTAETILATIVNWNNFPDAIRYLMIAIIVWLIIGSYLLSKNNCKNAYAK